MIERLSQINFKLKLGEKGLLRGRIGDLVEDVKQWGVELGLLMFKMISCNI